jgi:hypothetical protein
MKYIGFIEVLDNNNGRCNCQCVCGKRLLLHHSELNIRQLQSCGCVKRKFEDLTDKVVGRLVVEEYHHYQRRSNVQAKGYKHYWSCRCNCGTTIIAEAQNIRFSVVQSCGCLQRDRTQEVCRTHGLKPKHGYVHQYEKMRRADPIYRLRKNCSTLVWQSLKRNTGSKQHHSFFQKVPYTLSDLRQHLEQQFDENMTWDNYGSYWHVDHITPRSSFNYTSMDDVEFQQCWALSNLQPLSKIANLQKGKY